MNESNVLNGRVHLYTKYIHVCTHLNKEKKHVDLNKSDILTECMRFGI